MGPGPPAPRPSSLRSPPLGGIPPLLEAAGRWRQLRPAARTPPPNLHGTRGVGGLGRAFRGSSGARTSPLSSGVLGPPEDPLPSLLGGEGGPLEVRGSPEAGPGSLRAFGREGKLDPRILGGFWGSGLWGFGRADSGIWASHRPTMIAGKEGVGS